MAAVDDLIGQWIKRAEQSGELSRSKLFGRPFRADDGFEQTPEELRMAHKVLKNAGYVPAEVEAMQQIAALRQSLVAEKEPAEQARLRREIAELQQRLSLRLERLQR